MAVNNAVSGCNTSPFFEETGSINSTVPTKITPKKLAAMIRAGENGLTGRRSLSRFKKTPSYNTQKRLVRFCSPKDHFIIMRTHPNTECPKRQVVHILFCPAFSRGAPLYAIFTKSRPSRRAFFSLSK